MRSSTCGQIDVRRSLAGRRAARPSPVGCAELGHVLDRDDDLELDRLLRTAAARPHRRAGRRGSGRPPRPGGRSRTARCAGRAGRAAASSRSSDSARCAPRLVPATACTSSTITVSTPRSDSRAWRGQHQEQRLGRRDEDVGRRVGRTGGARRPGCRPSGSPTVTSGSGRPSRAAACRMPASGARRLRSTSTASAFSGRDVEDPAAALRLGGRRRRWPAGRATTGTPPASCRTGRRDDQGVAPGADRVPGARLGRGGRRERRVEPRLGGGGEPAASPRRILASRPRDDPDDWPRCAVVLGGDRPAGPGATRQSAQGRAATGRRSAPDGNRSWPVGGAV